jgi:hypothetical protein
MTGIYQVYTQDFRFLGIPDDPQQQIGVITCVSQCGLYRYLCELQDISTRDGVVLIPHGLSSDRIRLLSLRRTKFKSAGYSLEIFAPIYRRVKSI